ncbi:MAG: cell division protein FtsZ [Flavobacteriales bacterium]|jgi:cell division protein FtsZ|tara:strand:+ start:17882 stop:19675 length:1794 start_codon:yes stop_codon:yes gene_type:complete
MMQFDLEKEEKSIIKVFGVGGGGSNAVNHMYKQGIKGVDFFICNTDEQSLEMSPVPNKIQLGLNLTAGRGAGSLAEVGKNAALENIDEIREILEKDTKMLFITAGMGGGTGTGAAPIIARIAKELGILTVAIVTYPFGFEGRKRSNQADGGLEELRDAVDTCVIICNDKLREIYGNLSLSDAFSKADDILTEASKGIAEIITRTGYINVDFEDVRTVMTNSGVAIMGSSLASGENRAIKAAQEALESPLLNDNNIEGANYILLNITSGNSEVMMDEISQITDYIQDEAGLSADIIWGTGIDEELGDSISITLIATGFEANKSIGGIQSEKRKDKVVHSLKETDPAPQAVNSLKSDAVNPMEPQLKSAETPQVEQTRMELNVPAVEKKQEETLPSGWEVKAPVSVVETPVAESETPKIVHNLYDEAFSATVEQEEKIVEEDNSPTFEFEASDVEETSTETFNEREDEQNQAAESIEEKPFEPTFNKIPAEPEHKAPVGFEAPKKAPESSTFASELESEERLRRSQERLSQLNNLTHKLKSPSGITDLENEPAYIRRKVRLDNLQHSSESSASRFTLGDDGENNPEIRSNNSFLHDNVD